VSFLRRRPRAGGAAVATVSIVGLGVAFAVAPDGAAAQTLRGIVSERETYEPIALATVTLLTQRLDTLGTTLTTDEGYFSFDVGEPGSYYLIATALGYRPVRADLVTLEEGEARIVEIPMAVRPIPVGGVVVETALPEAEVPGLAGTGFYDRWSKGEGQFLLPGEVARHPARFTPQLFRELTFVRLVPSGAGPGNDQILVNSHTRMKRDEDSLGQIGSTWCEPWVYVDDRPLELMPGEGLDDAVPRETVEAIEVYMYPFGPPMRYFRNLSVGEACGVVLIWTKR
jgi:hypothetical protein